MYTKRMKSKLWIGYNTAISLVGSMGYALMYFYVWNATQDYIIILRFSIFSLLASVTVPILSSVIARFVRPNILLAVGIFVEALAYYYISSIGANLDLVAFLSTIGFTLKLDCLAATSNSYKNSNDLGKTNSINQIIRILASILSPILVGLFSTSFGASNSLIILFYISSILALLILFTLGKRTQSKALVLPLSIWLLLNRIGNKLVLNIFATGLLLGFSWGIIDILAYEQLGGVTGWSQFAIVVAILSIVVSYSIGKLGSNTALIKSISVVPIIVLGLIVSVLIRDFSKELFIVFLATYKVFTTVTFVASNTIYAKAIAKIRPEYSLTDQGIIMTINFLESLGSITLIGILFILPIDYTPIGMSLFLVVSTTFSMALMRKVNV